jgi:tripartite ATP-independent transporter DctM subunit
MIWLLIASSFCMIMFGVPMAVAIGAAAIIAIQVFLPHIPTQIVAQRIISAVDSFPLVAVPMFILAGEIMNIVGITDRLINLSKVLFGWIKGGLGLVNIATSVFFAGISGSATADAAGIGRILIPAMKKQGYDGDFAAAVTAASSTIGPIIPPSIVMVIYASMTSISIGKLFLAGVIPGLLLGAFMMILNLIFSIRRGYPIDQWLGWGNFIKRILQAIGPLGAPGIIIAGVIFGYFGPTEAGAIVVAYSIFLGLIYRKITFADFMKACYRTSVTVGVILFAIASASVVSWVMAVGQVPLELTAIISSFGDDSFALIIGVIVVLLVMGLFLDGLAAMVIMVPVFVPLTAALGMDPIQFAMIVILCLVVGAITPPVGILLMISCEVGEVPYGEAARTIWAFVLVMLLVVLAVAFYPQLTIWLPTKVIG